MVINFVATLDYGNTAYLDREWDRVMIQRNSTSAEKFFVRLKYKGVYLGGQIE